MISNLKTKYKNFSCFDSNSEIFFSSPICAGLLLAFLVFSFDSSAEPKWSPPNKAFCASPSATVEILSRAPAETPKSFDEVNLGNFDNWATEVSKRKGMTILYIGAEGCSGCHKMELAGFNLEEFNIEEMSKSYKDLSFARMKYTKPQFRAGLPLGEVSKILANSKLKNNQQEIVGTPTLIQIVDGEIKMISSNPITFLQEIAKDYLGWKKLSTLDGFSPTGPTLVEWAPEQTILIRYTDLNGNPAEMKKNLGAARDLLSISVVDSKNQSISLKLSDFELKDSVLDLRKTRDGKPIQVERVFDNTGYQKLNHMTSIFEGQGARESGVEKFNFVTAAPVLADDAKPVIKIGKKEIGLPSNEFRYILYDSKGKPIAVYKTLPRSEDTDLLLRLSKK